MSVGWGSIVTLCDVIMVDFYTGVVMWELWSGAQTPYLNLRNSEVKGKVIAS